MATRGESEKVQKFVAAVQVLAGRATLGEVVDAGEVCRDLTALIPERLQPPALRVVREIVAQIACRLQIGATSDEMSRQLPELLLAMLRAESSGELRKAFSAYLLVRGTRPRRDRQPGPSDPRVVSALKYIQDRSSSTALTLADVASEVGLSRWHVDRLLRRHTGRCFKAHVREARLNSAGGLLLTTGLSVKEIAARVGYSHATDFNRQFKRAFSSTPTEWRRVRRRAES